MASTGTVWKATSGVLGSILIAGTLIPTALCGCLPAEKQFLYSFEDPPRTGHTPSGIDRNSFLEKLPLGATHKNLVDALSNPEKSRLGKWCKPNPTRTLLDCTVRFEGGWFGLVERYKRVSFQFEPDNRLSGVAVDSYILAFGKRFDG